MQQVHVVGCLHDVRVQPGDSHGGVVGWAIDIASAARELPLKAALPRRHQRDHVRKHLQQKIGVEPGEEGLADWPRHQDAVSPKEHAMLLVQKDHLLDGPNHLVELVFVVAVVQVTFRGQVRVDVVGEKTPVLEPRKHSVPEQELVEVRLHRRQHGTDELRGVLLQRQHHARQRVQVEGVRVVHDALYVSAVESVAVVVEVDPVALHLDNLVLLHHGLHLAVETKRKPLIENDKVTQRILGQCEHRSVGSCCCNHAVRRGTNKRRAGCRLLPRHCAWRPLSKQHGHPFQMYIMFQFVFSSNGAAGST
mmetsp:Transcript_28925/g.66918  ORF Transcript_28925/g.66918 Transcript_28925/m.66918 type:complete len:307 (-) Transcript_28925:773-1693(-)